MLLTWFGIFAVSLLAEVVTTCYYRALGADGPGRRRRAMIWSGACRIISLLLLKRVIAAEGAAGLIAATAFVAGDVVGTWVALWYEDRTAASAPAVPPVVATDDSRLDAAFDARFDVALEERLEREVAVAVAAALRDAEDRRVADVDVDDLSAWRVAHPRAPRRVVGAVAPRVLAHRAPVAE